MGPAKIYFISFGILTIAGGIIGYVKAASLPSIIAGGITGIAACGRLSAAGAPRGGACDGVYRFTASRRPVRSQISANWKSDARRYDVDLECDRDHRGDCRLAKKVIAWEEFGSGRGGGS